MNLEKKYNEGIAIPVSDAVLLPGMVHTLKLNRFSEKEIEKLANEEEVKIALLLKQNFNQNGLKEEDFYRVGVSFKINEIEKTQIGYKIKIKVLDRVDLKTINFEEDLIRVEFEFASDIVDISETSQKEMVDYIKKVSREISNNFKGTEDFMENLEEQKDLNNYWFFNNFYANFK